MSKQRILLKALNLEKMIQHSLTALFFVYDVPGVGKPDIGSVINLDYSVMAMLNVLMFLGFLFGFIVVFKGFRWGELLVGGFSFLDIFLEFGFHGFGYLTVSVVVSVALIGIIFIQRKTTHVEP